jgi:hypothetical protein
MDGNQKFMCLSDAKRFQKDIRMAGFNAKLIKHQGISQPWSEVIYTLKKKPNEVEKP